MTQTELAQALGITQAAVSKLARRGMPTDSVERATRWRRRHLQTGRMKGVRADTIAPTAKQDEPASPHVSTAPEDLDLFADEDPDETKVRNFREARERREHYAAEMARLNFERETGQLLVAQEVLQAVANAATELRASLEQLPDTIAPALVGKDERQIATELASQVHRLLDNLSARFGEVAKGGTHG